MVLPVVVKLARDPLLKTFARVHDTSSDTPSYTYSFELETALEVDSWGLGEGAVYGEVGRLEQGTGNIAACWVF